MQKVIYIAQESTAQELGPDLTLLRETLRYS